MIAIQLNALKIDDRIILNFTKVLDEVIPGEDDEDDDGEGVDRDYWEKKGPKDSLQIADSCLDIIHRFNPSLSLKYNKYYIGLADKSRARNFVIFRAKRHFLRVEAKISEQEPWLEKLEEAELVILTGIKKRMRIIFRLEKEEIKKHSELLENFFLACYKEPTFALLYGGNPYETSYYVLFCNLCMFDKSIELDKIKPVSSKSAHKSILPNLTHFKKCES
jgi:hypothetical protein